MARRNQKIQEFDIVSGTPGATCITCAKLGQRSFQVVVAGDDAKNVRLWKISKKNSLLNFQGHSSDITSVGFSETEEEVYSGSFGGTVIVWDLTAQKAIGSLKGHLSACTSIASFPGPQGNYLATSSVDCNIKLWDLRKKTCVQTYKGHNGPVNVVQFSPDTKWLASGGSDGTVKLWDLNSSKKLYEFSLGESPVTSLCFNPQNLSLVSGHQDRTAKYWDLETFGHIATTSPDTTPIQQICFDPNGDYVFSAANESLKVWEIETPKLVDNIESTWRGVEDIQINEKDQVLVGLCNNSPSFSMWATDLNDIQFEASEYRHKVEEQKVNPTAFKPKKREKQELYSSFIPNNPNQPVGLDINEFIPKNKGNSDELRVFQEVNENHNNMLAVIRRRTENVNLVLNWWQAGNVHATINALSMMNDISVTQDVLKYCIVESKVDGINIQTCSMLLPLAQNIIESKYESYIMTGLHTVAKLLSMFRPTITSALTAQVMSAVDLTREERLKKCQAALSAFLNILNSPALTKNVRRENQVGSLSREVKNQLETFEWECKASS